MCTHLILLGGGRGGGRCAVCGRGACRGRGRGSGVRRLLTAALLCALMLLSMRLGCVCLVVSVLRRHMLVRGLRILRRGLRVGLLLRRVGRGAALEHLALELLGGHGRDGHGARRGGAGATEAEHLLQIRLGGARGGRGRRGDWLRRGARGRARKLCARDAAGVVAVGGRDVPGALLGGRRLAQAVSGAARAHSVRYLRAGRVPDVTVANGRRAEGSVLAKLALVCVIQHGLEDRRQLLILCDESIRSRTF